MPCFTTSRNQRPNPIWDIEARINITNGFWTCRYMVNHHKIYYFSCYFENAWWHKNGIPLSWVLVWASYQIRGLRMRLECRERFPGHRGLAISTCFASRHIVPGIPGACATRNFAYLVRGPWAEVPDICLRLKFDNISSKITNHCATITDV